VSGLSASSLGALTLTAERLVDRHLATTREWFPHEVVPWSAGRDFEPGYQWSTADTTASAAARSALFVNLLTEDNLPYYFRDIAATFGVDNPWDFWSRRWTAEEGRHSIAIRDYLTVTRMLDPVELERARMVQVTAGVVPRITGREDLLVYAALQELATRISHLNTAKALPDEAGYQVMKRVAADENLHYLFYRDLVTAAIELEPGTMMAAIERQVRTFKMPGLGIPGFRKHARAIAAAGIYDMRTHHDQVLVNTVLCHWNIEQVEGLDDTGQRARDAAIAAIARVGRFADRLSNRTPTTAAAAS
jgi:acyl-[acyl-carrier-protein] desaturase